MKAELEALNDHQLLPAHKKLAIDALGEGVRKDGWHLQQLGTVPEARRQGVAAALIQAIREKKGQHRMVLEVENPENVGSWALIVSTYIIDSVTVELL
jgi:GNAT superfamily N-acetyltransferase